MFSYIHIYVQIFSYITLELEKTTLAHFIWLMITYRKIYNSFLLGEQVHLIMGNIGYRKA